MNGTWDPQNYVRISYPDGIGEKNVFVDILNVKCSPDYWFLTVIKPDLSRLTYYVGMHEDDVIYYKGISYGTNDFPELAKLIHNRNMETLLEDLE